MASKRLQACLGRFTLDGRRWVGVILALGFALRIVAWARNRSLWADEAFLALNLLHRDWHGLLAPLDLNQGAPIGFLYAMKTALFLFGNHECALRLVPLLTGLAALPMFYLVCRRLFAPCERLLALLLFATLGSLIYYSAEAKQYSSDVLFTLIFLWLALRLEHAGWNRNRAWGFAAAGALGLWFSHPLIFILTAILLVQFGDALQRENWPECRLLLLPGLLWLASFGLFYVVSLSHLNGNPRLLGFWEGNDAFPPHNLKAPAWLIGALLRKVFTGTLWIGGFYLAACALWLMGHFRLLGRDRKTWFLLVTPILVTLIASALRRYPFSERLLLFLVPIYILLLVKGVELMRNGPRPFMRPLLFVLIFFLALGWRHSLVSHTFRLKNPVRPMIAQLAGRAQARDFILVLIARPLFDYYAERMAWPQAPDFQSGRSDRFFRCRTSPSNDQPRGAKHSGKEELKLQEFAASFNARTDPLRQPAMRLWLIGGSHQPSELQLGKQLIKLFDATGQRIVDLRQGNARLVLYNLDVQKTRQALSRFQNPQPGRGGRRSVGASRSSPGVNAAPPLMRLVASP